MLARQGAVICGYRQTGIHATLNLSHFVRTMADNHDRRRRVVRDARVIIQMRNVGANGSGYNWHRQGGVPDGLQSVICIDLLWLIVLKRIICTLLHPRSDKSKLGVAAGGRLKSSREHCMKGG